MNKIICFTIFLFWFVAGHTQALNNDYKSGAINIALPKTPESQSFEQYGKIPVSELTGSANIGIPLYTLKSRFLEVPISLTYNSSGIKVNQEASWVGLGFDINAGGRITVETKGCLDKDAGRLFSNAGLKYGLQKLFTRLGNSNPNGILTFASTCTGCDTSVNHNVPDDAPSINAMSQFGIGEPDIYHANFLGHSLTFFFDILTDSLKFIGEKSLFNIALNKDSYGNITNWTITDNLGNIYYFNQQETTTLTMAPLGPLQNNTSTSAWLLTKIVDPTGDPVTFTYANYGNSYPVSDWTSSMSFMESDRALSLSDDSHQNQVIQAPQYLSRIETTDAAADFILSSRNDIKGAGSKKLDQIKISNKADNTVKKKISFSYDYFNANLGSCFTSMPDSVTSYYRLRLKLNTLTVNDSSSLEPPYKFFYNSPNSAPQKLSFAIDHWGYYNGGTGGSYSDPCSPKNLIPNTNAGTVLNYPALNGYAGTRECSPTYMPIMTLDSMVYPTGGSTSFIFEPHQSYYIGGGLRIKTINNYSLSKLSSSINYTYANAMYMGSIVYHTSSYAMAACYSGTGPGGDQGKDVISATGTYNDADYLVAYGTVTITQTDDHGNSNGYLVKSFNVPNPKYTSGGYGFDVLPAHWPTQYNNTTDLLFPQYAPFAPTPTRKLDGKLMNESYFNNSNALVKSVDYYYTQADYSQKLYSVKAIDNRIGGSDAPTGACSGAGEEFTTNGARRYTIFVSPAKSFYTLTDSVIEKTFDGANVLTKKTAYKYNSHFQQEYESVYHSDGTQTITHTLTSAEMNAPNLAPTGDALSIYNLKTSHIYDLPLEQTLLKRSVSGDSLVLQSRLNIYVNQLPQKVYILETSTPLSYRSQFVPLYYTYPNYPNSPSGSNFTLQMDGHYKLYSTADYSTNNHIQTLYGLQGNTAFLWDDFYNMPIAQCTNAINSDIACTSFETQATGNWIYSGTGVVSDASSPTGLKSYSLASGSIVSNTFNTNNTYIVSYWSKNGAQNVSGASPLTGATINGWTYYEHQVAAHPGTSITISGSGTIDELRLYPKGSLMTSYTYSPLIGLTSQCDPSNHVNYFEYDPIGRLNIIKDQRRNVLKKYEYLYQENYSFPYQNDPLVQTFTYSTPCAYGKKPTTTDYSVAGGKYGSFLSKADANARAQAEINANGQAAADAAGYCYTWYTYTTTNPPYGTISSNFAISGSSVNFSLVIVSNNGQMYGQIGTLAGPLFLPSVARYVSVTSGGKTFTLTFNPSGEVDISGPGVTPNSYVQLNGSYAL